MDQTSRQGFGEITELDLAKRSFGKVTELDIAKEFFVAATAKTFAGDRVTLTIRDGLEHMSFRFELSKEEIAELVEGCR